MAQEVYIMFIFILQSIWRLQNRAHPIEWPVSRLLTCEPIYIFYPIANLSWLFFFAFSTEQLIQKFTRLTRYKALAC